MYDAWSEGFTIKTLQLYYCSIKNSNNKDFYYLSRSVTMYDKIMDVTNTQLLVYSMKHLPFSFLRLSVAAPPKLFHKYKNQKVYM